jgi:GH24 family phage-related lysozyme (muramidase)
MERLGVIDAEPFYELLWWWDSPYINHFLQPDTVIPNSANPQSWNRYSYVQNRPMNFNDPTGHWTNETNDPVKERLEKARVYEWERTHKKNKDMKTSEDGKDFIKWWEMGKEPPRAYPYPDMGGNCTIGYGHLLPNENEGCSGWPNKMYRDPKLYPNGLSVTDAQKLFDHDILKFETLINGTIKVVLTQAQFDALVSYTFNTGDQTNNPYFEKGIPELINSGQFEEAAAAMASGPITSGDPPTESDKLIERRLAEVNLFLHDNYGNYAPWKP